MVAVGIIGILASIATPSYQTYVRESKAAKLLVSIHDIGLHYMDASYDERKPGNSAYSYYDSPGFGQAPEAFPGMDNLYQGYYNIKLASYVLDHSGFLNGIIDQAVPVVFLKSSDKESQAILHALDHLLQQEHVFISPSILSISLSNRHANLTHKAANASPINTVPAGPDNLVATGSGSVSTESTSGTNPSSTGSGGTTGSGSSSTQIPPTEPSSNPPSSGTPVAQQTTNQNTATSSSSSSTQPGRWCPPGWVKHHRNGC